MGNIAVVQAPDTLYVSFISEISQVATESLLAVCANLANQGVQKVYLLLASPGGSVMAGIAAYNILRAMPFHLITHNVGNVNSIANVIFLAGKERYASPGATFMFHGVGFDTPAQMRFEQKMLRERLDGIIADEKKIGEVISTRTGIPSDDVVKLFYEAVTKDTDYAKAHRIIDDVRDVQIPQGAPVHQLVFQR